MYCEACGVKAQTRHVAFYQNIGALVIRFSNTAEGHLCKSCIHRYFWSMTTVSLLLGWWGVISFILNPFFILNNIIRYLGCLGMKAPPPSPAWDEEAENVPFAAHNSHSVDARPTTSAATAEECYLCGRTLRPQERQSRICQACS